MDWTQPPKMTMPKSPKAKESSDHKIKRFVRRLEDEHLTNLLLNEAITILDAEYGTCLQKQKVVSLERACMLLGIMRQAIYQREKRAKLRAIELEPVKTMVLGIRRFIPCLGGMKLYFYLYPNSLSKVSV